MTPTLFDQAMTLHSTGRVDDAMALYQQIVEEDASHAGAIHLLGVGLSQKGQFVLAVQFIQNAIVLNGSVPEFHINLGNALMGLEQAASAQQAYGQAVALQADIPEAWFGLGNARRAQQRRAEAIDAYHRAIVLRPEFAEALVNMGGVLIEEGRLDEAVAFLAKSASLRPNDAQPRYLMAKALEAAGFPGEAAALYASLVELPQCAVSLLFEAGKCLAALGHHAQAAQSYRLALTKAPSEAALWNNLGNALRDLDQLDDARGAYAQAMALSPNDPKILSNLGTAIKDLGDLPAAVTLLRQAAAAGGDALVLSNLGHALYLQGHLDQAADCFRQGLQMEPGHADSRFHLGVVQLRQGNWAEGWRNYESRWYLERAHEALRHTALPRWDGGDLTGKTILLWSEQGLGDTLHFIRLAQQVKAMGARVVVECQAPLVSVIQAMPDVDQVVAVGQAVPPCDVQVPLLSLPAVLGLTLDTLPPMPPYLTVGDRHRHHWQDRVTGKDCKVGLVWSGESSRRDVECRLIDRRRSLALADLAAVLAQPGIQFVSLQMGPARDQVRAFPQVLDVTDGIMDFADTAAVIEQLDLVVSVDTSVAHLAAGMGKPVWLLSRFDACWRWLEGRRDSPWYPQMTIYGQSQAGEWQQPIAALAQDMAGWVESRLSSASRC